MFQLVVLVCDLFILIRAQQPLSTVIGRTALHGTTGYINIKVDLNPIFQSAQNTLDVLDHAAVVLSNDTVTLQTYQTDITQTLQNINHVLSRSVPKRDTVLFVQHQQGETQSVDQLRQALDVPTRSSPSLPAVVAREDLPPVQPLPNFPSLDSNKPLDRFPPTVLDETRDNEIPQRQERSAGIVEGVIAISNLANSVLKWFIDLTQQSEITTIKYKVDAITQALMLTQSKVDNALDAYSTLALRITDMENSLTQIQTLTRVTEIAVHTSMILQQIYLALLELKQNRLPMDIVKPHELFVAHHTIEQDMAEDNMSPVFPSDLLYEVPVDALYHPEKGLYIFIPVYAVKDNSMIDLYRFNYIPIQVTDSTLMSFDIEYPYLALSANANPVGKVFTQKELDACLVVRDFYHCPAKNYVRTDLTNLCSYNLLMANKDGMLEHCKVTFENERSKVYQVEGNDFIVFSTKPDTLTTKCIKDETQETTQYEYLNSVAFSLNRTCPEATTSRYKFSYQSSHHINSQILCDPLPFNESIIGQIIPKLSNPLAAALPSMGTFDLSDFDTPPHAQVYLQIVVNWLKDYAFIIICISITYVLCHTIYCCRSRDNRNPQRLAYQDQLRVALKA